MKVRSVLGIVAGLFYAATLPAQIITNVVPPLGGHGEPFPIKILGGGFAPGNKHPNKLSVDFNGTVATTAARAGITDDDLSRLDIADAAIAEGDNGAAILAFAVTLTPPSSTPVTVAYASRDKTATAGQDYRSEEHTS